MHEFLENRYFDAPVISRTPGSILRRTRKGRAYNMRPLKQDDVQLLTNFFSRLSASTLLKRYFVGYNSLSDTAIDQEILRLNQICKAGGKVLVTTCYIEGLEEIVGLGELIQLEEFYLTAELALTIRDDYQGEGIGSALSIQLVNEARKRGLVTLRAETMALNRPMIQIWTKLGLPYSFKTSASITTMTALLNHQ